MTGRFLLACALTGIAAGGCQQTVVLDDLAPDAGPPGTGGTSGIGPSDASADGHCIGNQVQQINATPDTPEVVVALDRSSEMTETPFGQQDTEFTAAVSDLSAEVGHYVQNGQHPSRRAISFAHLEFPDSSNDCINPGCCASAVAPTESSLDFGAAAMTCEGPANSCGPSADRPIAGALISAYTHFQSESTSSGAQTAQRYVLLVTADAPGTNCPENDCLSAQNEISMLVNDLNVWTVIVHVGTSATSGCLQNLATTQPGPPPSYYAGMSLYYDSPGFSELQYNIEMVMSAVVNGACRFTLSTTPSAPSQLSVSFGQGMPPIGPGLTNGWTYDPDNYGTPRLILHGSACTTYLDSQFAPQVYEGCVPEHPGQTPP